MAGDVSPVGTGTTVQGEPIKIVPLKAGGVAPAAAAPPQLVYNNGALLTAVQVFTVFWGSAWQQSPASDTMQSLNGYFDYILSSALIDQLAEYNVTGQQIGHGSHVGTTVVTPDPATTVAY